MWWVLVWGILSEGHWEVVGGVVVADVGDGLVEEGVVVWELAGLDEVAEEIAKDTSEVFVSWEGEEAA